METNLFDRISNAIKNFAAGIVAVTTIGLAAKWIYSNSNLLTVKIIEPITTGANFLVVLIFCFISIKVPKLEFDKEYIHQSEETKILNRVNKLIKQLNTNILLYAGFLILVYFLYLLQSVNDNLKVNSLIDEFANLCNFLSSVFIYLSFKVLYDKTLDEGNEQNYYFIEALVFSMLLFVTYLIFTRTDIMQLNYGTALPVIRNNFSLVIGIFNGLAMGLLFARIISMENSLSNVFELNKKQRAQYKLKSIIKNFMIFILPLYAVVQPLFGNFKMEGLGNPDIHKNLVFAICFVGKLFFLSIYYYYMHRRWIHLYLFKEIINPGIPISIKNKFRIIETHLDPPQFL